MAQPVVRFGILGPVELSDGERRLPVGGPRQLTLLAFLLLHANRAVSSDQLIDALWDERNPAGALKRLQVAIARLRKALAVDGFSRESRLKTAAGGYLLAVGEGELDADVFQRRVQDGRRALEAGQAEHAAEALRGGLALWRGPPLAEVAYESFAQAEIRRLEELWLAAIEARVEADLRLGRHAALVGELEGLFAGDPGRERLAGQLMLALYRCGRQADALDVYQRTRVHLAAELGLEPGPALKALQAQVLEQSPSLELAVGDGGTAVALRRGPPHSARLPARPASLLGRSADTRDLIDSLGRDDVRLVTLVGAGGVGKTSLAIEVAHRLGGALADGAAFVDLAPLVDPDGAADAVLYALGCTPEPGATASETLCRLVTAREQLLVLDNFEHLLVGAPLLSDLLDAAPRLKLLVTSRAALDLQAEHRYRLDPLALPGARDPAAVAAAPATALFIARTAARDPGFRLTPDTAEAIAAVCDRLDGLPLAIELAAARTSTLSPQEIADRLDDMLATLGSGRRDAPDRQRTLRATLDWSYQLLDEPERVAFARLAVFAGGSTVDAAHHVTGVSLDVIDGLIGQSLLSRRPTPEGETRLVMLEPVREYAAERLATQPDHEGIRERHSRYYLQLADTTGTRTARGHDRPAGFRRLDAEARNLERALAHARRSGNLELGLSAAIALESWWHHRALWSEGRRWIEDALGTPRADIPLELRAEGLRVVASLSIDEADLEHSIDCAGRALELFRVLDAPGGTSRCLSDLAAAQLFTGDIYAAQATAAEAVRVARQTGDRALASALRTQAITTPDFPSARRIASEASELLEQAGDLTELAGLWADIGFNALIAGANAEADQLIARSLELSEQIDDSITSTYALGSYALVALEIGDHATAAARIRDTLQRCRTHGLRRPVCDALTGLAAIAATANELHRAARLTGAATAHRFGQAIDPVEQRLREHILNPARHRLGALNWEHAHASGRQLSFQDAITFGIDTARQHVSEAAHAAASAERVP
jgi:predicted ATPase/DNA-binding SARP family transcriptional activator